MIGYLGDTFTTAGMLSVSLYICVKSVNVTLSTNIKILSIIWCTIWTVLSALALLWIPLIMIRLITCVIFCIFTWKCLRLKLDTAISAYLMAYGISYSLLFIATLSIGLIFGSFMNIRYGVEAFVNIGYPLYLLLFTLVFATHFMLAYLLFRIKRFKNGFPFLFEKYAIIVALVVAGLILFLVSLIGAPHDAYMSNYTFFFLVAGVIIAGAVIIIWVRRGIKAFYNRRMKEHSIETLEQELIEKDMEIRRLMEQNNILRTESHKINHRIAALEHGVSSMVQKMQDSEISSNTQNELSDTLSSIQKVLDNYQEGISKIKGINLLPSTKISMLDNIFDYFFAQCEANNIGFILKVCGSIPFMVEQLISQSSLETLIGDHLQNAVTAVNLGDNAFRNILAVLGLIDGHYVFSVFDSGIPFEVDTLVRLGAEPVTTHIDTGGSGIGFMTTFETIREYGASLVISEKKPVTADYSKSITIRFDKKNQYTIKTYRPESFPPLDESRLKIQVY
ncbi:MAG: hypothetical protein FWC13_02325 [Oscillospiraceae bacterium]|nr:hypothetical protein [Oscillospiraceae bacterium]